MDGLVRTPSAEEAVPPALRTQSEPPKAATSEPEGLPTVAVHRARSARTQSTHARADEDVEAQGVVTLSDPWFPDEVVALICSFLGVRDLCHLACVSARFTERVLTEPDSGAQLSPIEEGARLNVLLRHPRRTIAPVSAIRPPWLHALARLNWAWEKYPHRLGDSKYFVRRAHELDHFIHNTEVEGLDGLSGEIVTCTLNMVDRLDEGHAHGITQQASLMHENIAKVKDIVQCNIPLHARPAVAVVTEALSTELFDAVVEGKGFTEPCARIYFRQLLVGLAYMHARGIAHGEIRLDALYVTGSDRQRLKISTLAPSSQEENRHQARRSPSKQKYQAAPEMLSGDPYDAFKADIWSAGVVLFCMTEFKFPFFAETRLPDVPHIAHSLAQFRNLMTSTYNLKKQYSAEYEAFLKRLLCVDVQDRPTAAEALLDPWILEGLHLEPEPKPEPEPEPGPEPEHFVATGAEYDVVNDDGTVVGGPFFRRRAHDVPLAAHWSRRWSPDDVHRILGDLDTSPHAPVGYGLTEWAQRVARAFGHTSDDDDEDGF